MPCKCHPDPNEIRITLDGDKWCALRGEDLQVGESGFGDSPEEALRNLLRIEKLNDEYARIKATFAQRCEPPGEPSNTCVGCPYLIKDQCLRSMILTCLAEGTQPIYIGISTRDLADELKNRDGVSQWLVRHDDQYAVRFVPHTGKEHSGSLEPGPATILVVVD